MWKFRAWAAWLRNTWVESVVDVLENVETAVVWLLFYEKPIRNHTYECSHLARSHTRAARLKKDLEPLPGPQVFGYTRWRGDWVKSHKTVVYELPQLGKLRTRLVMSVPTECHDKEANRYSVTI